MTGHRGETVFLNCCLRVLSIEPCVLIEDSTSKRCNFE